LKFLFILLLSIIFSGCSTIVFQNESRVPFLLSSSKGSDEVVTIEGTAEFYFWGLFPKVYKIDLSEEFKDSYLHNPSMVKYKRKYGVKSLVYTFLTLGFYMPEDFEISVYTKRGEVQ